MGIRVWIEVGSEWSDEEGVVKGGVVWVGLEADGDNDGDSCWRFTRRRPSSWDATLAKWRKSEMKTRSVYILVVMLVVTG